MRAATAPTGAPGAAARPGRRGRHALRPARRIGGLLGALSVAGLVLGACSSAPAAPPASIGNTLEVKVPAAVRQLSFVDQHGGSLTLASWPGKTLLVVPFLSLCTEICPMTTGDLYQVARALRADGAAGQVQIVEISVDPGRDSPARLAAYGALTGASWPLLTESPATLANLSHFLGWYYQRVPEGNPPSIDWWTHQTLTYDVAHSDGFDVISPGGRLRFSTGAEPAFHGALNPALRRFLSPFGRRQLAHPGQLDYTPADILQALGWSMGQNLAPAPS